MSSNPAISPADAPPAAAGRPRWKRGLVVAALLVGLALAYATGVFGLVPVWFARRSLENHEPEQALNQLRWTGWLAPPSGQAEFLRARAYRKLGALDSFPVHLRAAMDLGYPAKAIRREELLARAQSGDIAGIIPELNQLLVDPGDDGADICEAYANGCLASQRFDLAEMILETWEKSFPDDPGPNEMRGRLHQFRKDTQAAEAEFRAALRKKPDHARAAFSLGRLLLDRLRPGDAVNYFALCNRGLTAGPAQVFLAKCDVQLGTPERARERLEQVAALDPGELEAGWRALGEPNEFDVAAFEIGRLEMAASRPEQAIPWFRRALNKNPNDVDARYNLGVALRQAGRVDEAIPELQRATQAREALAEVGQLLDLLAKEPDNIEARHRIGRLFLEHGSAQTALFWLKSVLSYDPKHAPTHQILADYYERRSADEPQWKPLAEHHRNQAKAALTGGPR